MFALTSGGVRVTPSAFADTRRNWLPSPLTLSWLLAVQPRGAAAGDARCADRVGAGRRPGGRWLRRNPRPAGRQRYGFMLYEYDFGGKWLELLKEIAPGVK